MEPYVLAYDPWGLGGRAVLQGPAQWPPLGLLPSPQSPDSWGAAEDKTAVDKILPLFKKRFSYFKSSEATTLMTCHLVNFLLIFTYSET